LEQKANILFLTLLLLFSSCILDTDDKNISMYPLKVGNQWDYIREWNLYFYNEISNIKVYSDTITYTSDVSVSVTAKMNLNGNRDVYKVDGSESTNVGIATTTNYYKNKDDGLYIYAYSSGGGPRILPKNTTGNKVCFKGMQFDSFKKLSDYVQSITPLYRTTSDSIIFEDPILKSIQYPIEIGSQWTYREEDNPWRMDKKVISYDNIQIDIGNFDCHTIQFIYDIDRDGVWDDDIWINDYISKEGLIKREINVLGMIESTIEYPGGTGRKFDGINIYTLTSYELQ